MAPTVAAYVEVADLFPERRNSLEDLADCLGQLDLDATLVLCAQANGILAGPTEADRLERQKMLANSLLSAEAGRRLNRVAWRRAPRAPAATAFLTRSGVLELLRWALLLCRRGCAERHAFSPAEKELFAQAAMICAWLSEVPMRRVLDQHPAGDALKSIALVFYRSAMDAGMECVEPYRAIGRGKQLLLDYLPRHYPQLGADFNDAMGVPLEAYLTAAGALVGMHLQLDHATVLADAVHLGCETEYRDIYEQYRTRQIWSIDGLTERLWPSQRVPRSPEEAPGYSLKPLRERSIIRLEDGRGVVSDPILLAESFMVGPLFRLLRVRNENEVFGHFGEAFEDYVIDILRRRFPAGEGLHQVFHPDVTYCDANGNEAQIDGCLDYVNRLVLVEAKAVFLPDESVVRCDEAAFKRALKEKYLCDERPVGVGQLARAVRALAAGTWRGPSNAGHLLCVHPVMVVHDRLLQAPFSPEYLADLLVGTLNAKPVAGSWQWEVGEVRLAPLTIIVIDDLENLESSVDIDLLHLLEAYSADEPTRRKCLHDYMAEAPEFSRRLRHNQVLARSATAFMAECSRRVFGRE